MVNDQYNHLTSNVHEISIAHDLVCIDDNEHSLMLISIRSLGNARKNQDLGEDEYRASNDDDTQRSNNSEENNNQENDNPNNYRGIVN